MYCLYVPTLLVWFRCKMLICRPVLQNWMKIVGYQIFLRITRFVILVIHPDYQKFCLRSTPARGQPQWNKWFILDSLSDCRTCWMWSFCSQTAWWTYMRVILLADCMMNVHDSCFACRLHDERTWQLFCLQTAWWTYMTVLLLALLQTAWWTYMTVLLLADCMMNVHDSSFASRLHDERTWWFFCFQTAWWTYMIVLLLADCIMNVHDNSFASRLHDERTWQFFCLQTAWWTYMTVLLLANCMMNVHDSCFACRLHDERTWRFFACKLHDERTWQFFCFQTAWWTYMTVLARTRWQCAQDTPRGWVSLHVEL